MAPGGAQQGLTAPLKPGAGTFYWSVQAVDAGLAGGPFATEARFAVWSYQLPLLQLNDPTPY